MRTWFKNLKHKREPGIEAELRASRPTPSRHLVKSIVARVDPRPVPIRSARSRIAFAGVATAAMVAAIGASGGFGYAASSVVTAAKATAHAVHFDAGPNLPGSHDAGSPGASSAGAQYLGAPTITKLSATSGKVGSSVTVTGTNLGGITDMTVAGVEIDLTTIVNSTTNTVVFKVPDNGGNSAVGPVTVTNPAGTATFGSFTLIVLPQITSLDPGLGNDLLALKPGQTLTINGSGFLGVNIAPGGVTISSKPAKFIVDDDATIEATVPTGVSTTVPGKVVVKNAAGSATSTDSVQGAVGPTITSLGKTSGLVGDVLQINGMNFDVNVDTVTINGDNAPIVNSGVNTWTATKAFVNVPTPSDPSATEIGPVQITDGTGIGTSAKNFTTIVAPSIAGFDPTPGTKIGGTVTLTGLHFSGTSSVKFSSAAKASPFKVVNDTTLTTVVPLDAHTGDTIRVTNGAGFDDSGAFTVLAAPTIDPTGVTAANPSVAGDTVDITGSNFVDTSTIHVKVFFGPKASGTANVLSSTHITVTVPVGAIAGKPKVVEAGGTATAAQTVTIAGAPVVSSFTPTSQIADGSHTIKITGKGFNGTNSATPVVTFGSGGTGAVQAGNTDTTLIVTVPTDAEIGPITVSADTGDGVSKASFTPLKVPTLVSFWPSQGQKLGGTLTIVGTHLSGATLVTFQQNGVKTPFTAKPKVLSDGILTVIVPAGAADGPITVTNPAGTSLTGLGSFVVLQPPTVTSMSVSSGTLTINGTNFVDTDDHVVTVKIGALVCTNVTVVNPTQVTCTVPSGATGKKLSVTVSEEAGKVITAPFQF
jgi:hypothetical protein